MSNLPAEPNPLKDKDNPKSIINLTPSIFSNAVQVIPEALFEMTEEELEKAANPSVELRRLRVAFWREYDQTIENKRKAMNMCNVYNSVTTLQTFNKKYVGNSFNLAYILRPPTDYEVSLMEAVNFGVEQLREILALPTKNPATGFVDTKLAQVKVNIVESLLERAKGSVTKRIETKNLNLVVEGTKEDLAPQFASEEEINRKLRLLEAKERGEIIEAEIKDVTEITPEEKS